MMLNIKLSELQQTYSTMIPIAVIFSLVFMFEIIFLFRTEFTYINSFSEESTFYLAECLNKVSSNTDLNNLFGTYTNIKTIALAIFTDYLYAFLVSAYVLLIAMIAAIILTLQKSFVSKTQDIYSQLMADYERTLVYYS
jgi:NADH:ubiquinone oxidoreductase subunit 6 (subunit J)